jgi:hypothetical protein
VKLIKTRATFRTPLKFHRNFLFTHRHPASLLLQLFPGQFSPKFQRKLPTYLSSDLVSALTSLNMNDFTHFEFFWGCSSINYKINTKSLEIDDKLLTLSTKFLAMHFFLISFKFGLGFDKLFS